MVYYRKKNFKRRTYRRRSTPWYRKKYSVAQMASKAIKGVSYLKGLVNAELHKHEVARSTTSVFNGGALYPLNAISQGDADDQRTGNSIFVRYVNITGVVSHGTDTVIHKTRVMLVRDKQQVGDTAPSPGDVLEDVGNNLSPFSKLNSQSAGRFDVLYSKLFITYPDRAGIPFNIKLNMRSHIRYNGAASGDIQKNGLYIVVIGDYASPYATAQSVQFLGRVSYYDN